MNPTTIETRDTDTESTATTAKPKVPKKAHPAAPKAHRATSGAGAAHHASTTKRRSKPAHARQGTKTAKVLALLQRPGGATLPQLQKATGWLPHLGFTLTSTKDPNGERRYRLER
jgi:hypothetical protein